MYKNLPLKNERGDSESSVRISVVTTKFEWEGPFFVEIPTQPTVDRNKINSYQFLHKCKIEIFCQFQNRQNIWASLELAVGGSFSTSTPNPLLHLHNYQVKIIIKPTSNHALPFRRHPRRYRRCRLRQVCRNPHE